MSYVKQKEKKGKKSQTFIRYSISDVSEDIRK